MGVKVLSIELENMRGEREFIAELAALSDIKHENLVRLRGCCVDGATRYLVYDYMENNSLSHTLLGKKNFLISTLFSIFFSREFHFIVKSKTIDSENSCL